MQSSYSSLQRLKNKARLSYFNHTEQSCWAGKNNFVVIGILSQAYSTYLVAPCGQTRVVQKCWFHYISQNRVLTLRVTQTPVRCQGLPIQWLSSSSSSYTIAKQRWLKWCKNIAGWEGISGHLNFKWILLKAWVSSRDMSKQALITKYVSCLWWSSGGALCVWPVFFLGYVQKWRGQCLEEIPKHSDLI